MHEALSQALAPIIGAAGFRAVFARSVKLIAADHPFLGPLPALAASASPADAVLIQVLDALAKLEPGAALELATSVYASFYALLTKMIGESLVEQIVKGAFPSIDESGSEGRD